MAWTLFLVSQHPDIEDKIVQELRQHGLLATADKPNPRSPSFDDLAELKYLSSTVKETLRLLPVRQSNQCVSGQIIEPVKRAAMDGWGSHRMLCVDRTVQLKKQHMQHWYCSVQTGQWFGWMMAEPGVCDPA